MEHSSFVRVLGDTPVIRVLDYLLEVREIDCSLTDIARGSEIAWSTLHLLWPSILKEKLVKKTRTIGRATMYKLNTDSPVVKKLLELDHVITNQYVDEELRRQKAKKVLVH